MSKGKSVKTEKNDAESITTSHEEQKLDDLIRALVIAAEAKGWWWQIDAKDMKAFHYSTISVARNDVEGTFEITCDSQVKLTYHKTSFYNHGLSDLSDAALNEICKIPWVKASKKIPKELFSDTTIIHKLLRNFHKMVRQLKHRHNDRDAFLINDEYDVQDFLHVILRGLFEDIRPEEYTPSYAGGSSRMDFLLKKEQIVIETKIASLSLKDKQVGEQLLIDIARYQSHPDCKQLICFVYDPLSNLKNPTGLETDLSKKHGELNVKVIVVSPS